MFRLSFQQTGVVTALWLALLMLPLAPLNTRFSAAGIFLFVSVAFISRNIAAIGLTTAVLNLAARLFIEGSFWHDQHWVQWSSISALLTGHQLFATSPLYQFSLTSYMPAGDLFGGVMIALGIQKYWLVWHVLVVCLVALPLVLAPSAETLCIFIVSASFYPFCDYTTGGGTLEIGYALTIAAIALFRAGKLLTCSLILFAFAAMFRQPSVVLVPFLLLILWRAREYRRIALFGAFLFLFGGFYIVTFPQGAFHYLYGVWDDYHQGLFNEASGLSKNYSIASLPAAFGVSDAVAWYEWKPVYTPILLCGLGLLFGLAWFRKKREDVLEVAVLATAAVYLLSRGYSQFGYVCTAFFPFVAFSYPVPTVQAAAARWYARGIALVFLWIGTVPLVLFASFFVWRQLQEFRPALVVHAAEVHVMGATQSLRPPDGDDRSRHLFSINSTVEFQLPRPEYLSGIRLSGDHIAMTVLKGISMRAPNYYNIEGVITDGIVEGSEDGTAFHELRHFHNTINYCVWPATISFPATAQPLKAIRIRPLNLYLGYGEWILGNIEFLVKR